MESERGGGADKKKKNKKIKIITFQERDQLKFYSLSDAILYDCISTINQFIKPFLDNKMSTFEDYGAFNHSCFINVCVSSAEFTWLNLTSHCEPNSFLELNQKCKWAY